MAIWCLTLWANNDLASLRTSLQLLRVYTNVYLLWPELLHWYSRKEWFLWVITVDQVENWCLFVTWHKNFDVGFHLRRDLKSKIFNRKIKDFLNLKKNTKWVPMGTLAIEINLVNKGVRVRGNINGHYSVDPNRMKSHKRR